MSWDPYKTLGVSRGASDDEIKRAHRKLAKELHPDVKPDDKAAEAQFKKVSAAYSLLSDKEKRARFDRGEIDADGNELNPFQGGFGGGGYGGAGPGGGFGGRGGFGGQQRGPSPDAFEDLFGGIFGQGGGRSRGFGPQKGSDVRYRMDVDFLEAVAGARKRVTMADGRALDINIPAGVESGQTLRLKAQGEPGPRGAPPGDAFVEVTVKPHSLFERDGDNLRLDLNISLAEAVEGGKVPVTTPTGRVSLTVPPGSNSGAVLRLKGKGVQRSSKPGDLLVKLLITLPSKPDEALKSFVKDWPQRDAGVRD